MIPTWGTQISLIKLPANSDEWEVRGKETELAFDPHKTLNEIQQVDQFAKSLKENLSFDKIKSQFFTH